MVLINHFNCHALQVCRDSRMDKKDEIEDEVDNSSPVTGSCFEGKRRHKVQWKEVPLGAWILSYLGVFNILPAKNYRLYILILTFICYASYHMSRKPFSVVANVLAPNCNDIFEELNESSLEYEYDCNFNEGWAPFNGSYCKTVIGAVDYAWLFTYAVFMIAR
ncbi:PREDICTED: glucose-6-phosphate exchanger SLC37A2-like [Amphimedon queenslandica]|uniref:Uncharacterized protein n=1 Tax=Amphimedon queenslandica TaxID=400682 RepID=A0AAN0JKC6_AMPQE|nr:PREDICTED: glucose-6-phosphate exchanger SLC37A2-like [Amphimedon queenslandica]|eukprot:XP_019857466.1 PREDICTED: glucose-6-phosphate exchanger SLC37A2-like [Amphimedon queenslandica]